MQVRVVLKICQYRSSHANERVVVRISKFCSSYASERVVLDICQSLVVVMQVTDHSRFLGNHSIFNRHD